MRTEEQNGHENFTARPKFWLAAWLILVFSTVLDSTPQDKKGLSYEPTVVELRGKLVVESKYGPPNYGENPQTDQQLRDSILVLSEPINIRGDSTDQINAESVEGAIQIELVFMDGKPALKKLVGREVVVKGTLFRAHTGHHYTDVLMTVEKIRKKA